jgi:hypothetical protein
LKRDAEIRKEVLAYLAESPLARDTLEGIVEWWLLKQEIRHTISEVEAVLENLVAQSLVSAARGADGRIYYRAHSGAPKNNDEKS